MIDAIKIVKQYLIFSESLFICNFSLTENSLLYSYSQRIIINTDI